VFCRIQYLDEVQKDSATEVQRLDQLGPEVALRVVLDGCRRTMSADEHVVQHGEAMRGTPIET
jgi:hypothetical protein